MIEPSLYQVVRFSRERITSLHTCLRLLRKDWCTATPPCHQSNRRRPPTGTGLSQQHLSSRSFAVTILDTYALGLRTLPLMPVLDHIPCHTVRCAPELRRRGLVQAMLGCKARQGLGHDVDLGVPVAGVLVNEAAAQAQHENAASIPETLAAVEIFAAATLTVVRNSRRFWSRSPHRRRS